MDNLVDKMEYTGMVYLNCIVLDISLNPFKDEGKQQSISATVLPNDFCFIYIYISAQTNWV